MYGMVPRYRNTGTSTASMQRTSDGLMALTLLQGIHYVSMQESEFVLTLVIFLSFPGYLADMRWISY